MMAKGYTQTKHNDFDTGAVRCACVCAAAGCVLWCVMRMCKRCFAEGQSKQKSQTHTHLIRGFA